MSTDKTIYFIRHGESTFNEWRFQSILNFSWIIVKDPMIIDARLSTKGKRQVSQLKETIHQRSLDKEIQLIITSPLTRAIETTLGGFEGCHIPIKVDPLCREMLDTACDIGRQPNELHEEFGSHGIDTSVLSEFWWLKSPNETSSVIPTTASAVISLRETTQDLDARIQAFLENLVQMNQSTIAVVCHSNFIKRITRASYRLSNCAIQKVSLQQLLAHHKKQ